MEEKSIQDLFIQGHLDENALEKFIDNTFSTSFISDLFSVCSKIIRRRYEKDIQNLKQELDKDYGKRISL
jgi:CRISPR/Cas system-associated protein endoribonuclease Cas2